MNSTFNIKDDEPELELQSIDDLNLQESDASNNDLQEENEQEMSTSKSTSAKPDLADIHAFCWSLGKVADKPDKVRALAEESAPSEAIKAKVLANAENEQALHNLCDDMSTNGESYTG